MDFESIGRKRRRRSSSMRSKLDDMDAMEVDEEEKATNGDQTLISKVVNTPQELQTEEKMQLAQEAVEKPKKRFKKPTTRILELLPATVTDSAAEQEKLKWALEALHRVEYIETQVKQVIEEFFLQNKTHNMNHNAQ